MVTQTTITFVEAPALQLMTIPIELINDVPAPTEKARQRSLIELGQVDPVRLRLDEARRYDIIDGRRRIANLQENGAAEVKALVEFIDDDQADLHSLALNISRSPSPMVEAKKLVGLLERGRTQQEIAKVLGVTQGFISQRLRLFDLIPALQDALELGRMTLTTARVARKLTQADQVRLAGLDKITLLAGQDMLRSYQAEMIDLTQIDIPEMTEAILEAGCTLVLSGDQMQALERGETISVEVAGKLYRMS